MVMSTSKNLLLSDLCAITVDFLLSYLHLCVSDFLSRLHLQAPRPPFVYPELWHLGLWAFLAHLPEATAMILTGGGQPFDHE